MKRSSSLVLACCIFPWAPAAHALSGQYETRALYAGSDAAHFGEYRGLEEEGGYLVADFLIEGGNQSHYWIAEGHSLGLSTYDFRSEFGRQDRYVIELTLDGIAQFKRDDGVTPYLVASDDRLGLPAGWTAGSGTSDFTSFSDNASNVDQELQRDTASISIEYNFNPNWRLDASFRQEQVVGTKIEGASLYFDASTAFAVQLPVDVDYDTTTFSNTLHYSGERINAALTLTRVEFDNKNGQVIWANPYGGLGNPNVDYPSGEASLSTTPDHERRQIRFTGGYLSAALPGLGIQWDSAWEEVERDEPLDPYTVNSTLIVTDPLPRQDLDADLDKFSATIRISYRPSALRALALRAGYRVDDRADDKPEDVFSYVRGDAFDQLDSSLAIYSREQDYEKERFTAGADYRLPFWRGKLSFDYEYEETERRQAAVQETEQDTYRGALRLSPFDTSTIRFGWHFTDQGASTYEWDQSFLARRTPTFISQVPEDQRFDNHPGLSQYHLANAETDELTLSLSHSGFDRWTIGFDYRWQDIEYDETEFGLTNAESRSYSLDVQYFTTARLTAYGYATLSNYETDAAGRSFAGGAEKPANHVFPPLPQASDPRRNWFVVTEDDIASAGAGLTWQMNERLNLELQLVYVNTESDNGFSGGGAAGLNTAGLPTVETELRHLTLSVEYALTSSSVLTFQYQHYDYKETDWAMQDVTWNTMNNLLGLGEQPDDENINLFGISFRHEL